MWRKHATARERLRAVVLFLALPARAAKQAVADVRDFGREVSGVSGVSEGRQLLQLWWLRVRHGITGRTYLQLQLYLPERWRRAGQYVQREELVRLAQFIKIQKSWGDSEMLYDKRRFDTWCRAHGLRTVTTLVEFHEGSATPPVDAGSLPARDLFSKPTDAAAGYGAYRWTYDGRGGYVGADGRARSAAELLEELAAASAERTKRKRSWTRILLQECLRNHHALAPLTPGALCTVRLQTYRWPDGEPELLLALYKMPTGNTPVDNFHFGGVAAPIDVATGRLGRPVIRRGKVIVPIDRHPDTGAVVEGRDLPFWQEAVELVLRGHRAVPRMAAVGWDVAIAEDGPVLVEANTLPSPDLAQMPSGVPLGETPFVRCLNAHLRECLV